MNLLVECERPTTRGGGLVVILTAILLFVVFGWVGLLLYRLFGPRWGGQQFGDYVAFDLPARACGHCRGELLDPVRANELVMAVPLYAKVLDRYPNAVVVRCSVDARRRMPNPFRRRRDRRLLMALVGVVTGLAFFVSVVLAGDVFLSHLKHSGGLSRDHRHLTLAGVVVVALCGGVLSGWGMSRVTGNVYRHFFPEMAKPSEPSDPNPDTGDRS